MCPSYMVTREEKHSTRGRAHLLFEMLNGDELDAVALDDEVLRGARPLPRRARAARTSARSTWTWRRYKAEFLSHYYERRLRPRHAYAFGLIDRRRASRRSCRRSRTRSRSTPARRSCSPGVASASASFPQFAPRTLQRLVPRAAARAPATGQQVILWPDTFNNHFHPEVGDRGRRGARGRRLPRHRSRARTSAAAGRSTTTGCSTSRGATSSACSTRCATRSARARRSSASSRAASRSSRTSCRS